MPPTTAKTRPVCEQHQPLGAPWLRDGLDTHTPAVSGLARDEPERGAGVTHRQPRVLDEPLISTNDVAVLLGVSKNTVKWWRHAGTGPPHRTVNGRLIRYRRAEVEAWHRAENQATTRRTGT